MSDKIIIIRGELFWAKIVGDAVPYTGNPKYDKGPYWSVDITPNKESLKKIKEAGIADKLREPKGEKETRKEPFLTLKVLETKPDGKKNNPPTIINGSGAAWDGSKIGNGSVADVLVKVKDYGTTVGAYLQKVRILSHIPYEGGVGFEPLSEDDEFFGGGKADVKTAPNPDELDDDVPF